MRALVTSTHLRRLRTLTFASTDSEADHTLSGPAMQALAANMQLRSVRHLDVGWNYNGDRGLLELAQATWLTQLERLNLQHTGLGDMTGDCPRSVRASS